MSRWIALFVLAACAPAERPMPTAVPSSERLESTVRTTIWSTGYGQSFDAYAAGDFDGDGYADLAIGAAQASLYTGLGAVWVHPGGAGGVGATPSLVLSGSEVYDFQGAALAVGDFDGDGYDDLAAGASGRDATGGAVVVYEGGAAGLSATVAGTLSAPLYGSFGAAVAAAGDVDGDGYEDLVVTDAFDGAAGALHLFRGGAAGLATTPTSTSLGAAGGYWGYAVAGLGDVNGDGYADVAVSDPYADGYDGEIQVFLGGPAGLAAAADQVLAFPGAAGWVFFGMSFDAAGDVNNDGYADLVAGAGDESGGGAVYLWLGGPGGFAASPEQTLAPGGYAFGTAVAGVGDMDGDGVDDVVVSDRWAASVWLYLGGSGGLAVSADSAASTAWPTWSEGFGERLLGAGDLDGDGAPDLVVGDHYLADWGSTVQGFAQVFHGERTVTVDADGDGWSNEWDCDDGDAGVLPWHCGDPRDLVVDGVVATYAGAVDARAVWVVNGGTLRIGAYDGGADGGWLQLDADLVHVDASSMIDGAGRGSPGGAPGAAGTGPGGGSGGGFGGGAGFGGAGGAGMASCTVSSAGGGASYGAADDFVIRRGSGGGGGAAVLGSSGRGGAGGAGLGVVAGELQLLGRLRVDGGAPGGGRAGERGGAGSGGSIVLDVGTLSCDGGVLSARGGPGTLGAAGAGGSGGGGRVQVQAGAGDLAGCTVRVGPGPERCAGAGGRPGSVYTTP